MLIPCPPGGFAARGVPIRTIPGATGLSIQTSLFGFMRGRPALRKRAAVRIDGRSKALRIFRCHLSEAVALIETVVACKAGSSLP
jgi:hypothetical protein